MSALPDFDELLHLAESSPKDFDQLRHSIIENTLTEASPSAKRRLAGLQFQIEMERRRAVSPLAACVRISQMMHDSLGELTALLRQESQHDYCKPHASNADVIPITRSTPP